MHYTGRHCAGPPVVLNLIQHHFQEHMNAARYKATTGSLAGPVVEALVVSRHAAWQCILNHVL